MSTSARSSDPVRYRGGSLWMEGVPLKRVARDLGTPAYVYSAGHIAGRFGRLQDAFARTASLICYAVKANPNRSVCRLLAGLGAGAEVVSGGEILRALAAGFPPSAVVFSGVGKTDEELALTLRRRLLALNVESPEELGRLGRVARRLGRPAPFAVRVNPGIDAGAHPHVATALEGGKFGVPPACALRMYRKAGRWLKPVGIHCHLGSQILRAGPYARALTLLLSLVDALAREGTALEHVDLGGGFGVRYGEAEAALDPRALERSLGAPLRRRGLRLLLEPGRYLVGEAGVLLTRVLVRKEGSPRHLVADAGMNDFLRPALYGARHRVLPVERSGAPLESADLVGPICESADVLASPCRLPRAREGDVLAILGAGAYGFAMSSQYNSRPRAAEALVRGSVWRTVRRRERVRDLVYLER